MTETVTFTQHVTGVEDRDVVVERIFNAPRERVWRFWTDPEYVKRWWGPKTFTTPVFKTDLRVGGKYLYCMRSSEGQEYWGTGSYREIEAPARLVCTDVFADKDGNPVPPSFYGMGDDSREELILIMTFEEHETRKTKFTLHHQGLPAGQIAELTAAGWNEAFDKLVENLRE